MSRQTPEVKKVDDCFEIDFGGKTYCVAEDPDDELLYLMWNKARPDIKVQIASSEEIWSIICDPVVLEIEKTGELPEGAAPVVPHPMNSLKR